MLIMLSIRRHEQDLPPKDDEVRGPSRKSYKFSKKFENFKFKLNYKIKKLLNLDFSRNLRKNGKIKKILKMEKIMLIGGRQQRFPAFSLQLYFASFGPYLSQYSTYLNR